MAKKSRGRGPVVHLNRQQKAQMIESIVSDFMGRDLSDLRILDIGCGNGDISSYFAQRNEQYGVDIVDQRKQGNDSFEFHQVESETLPFDDEFFDVVLSHHVIEHVEHQGLHLDEIWRVLKPQGVGYLATPNKSSPIMEGHVGNDQVLRHHQMAPLFETHRFEPHWYSCKLLRNPHKFHGEMKKAAWIPEPLLRFLSPLFPSQVYVLSKRIS